LVFGLPLAGFLWAIGAFPWLRMAANFLLQQRDSERRQLTILTWKLQILRAVAEAIGRTEAQIARIDRRDG
jgi:hypothetical protein